ncbi:MAG TPA: T9SS type A sorting domain-containing protein, partial [Chitinophagales bacterium]|nr:T9SS type A sorting domain-containing protein [Chitinophagales bacterium]
DPTEADIFPNATHLPHLVVDSAYDQTIQARIPLEITIDFLGFVQVDIRVDSIRLDSIEGLPSGITWVKNPDVLYGGEAGCLQFTGTTTDAPGEYELNPIGQIWAHLSAPIVGLDVDTTSYGSIDRIPPFRNFFLVVEPTREALTLTSEAQNLCFDEVGTGVVEIFAAGGSPVEPYTYNWSNGSQSYLLTDIEAGTYDVTVTSGTETATASVVVNQQQTPITLVATSNGGSTGGNGEAYVVASGGMPPYTYQWNNGAGTDDTATGLDPGTYRVTVRDAYGCTQQEEVEIQDLTSGIGSMLNGSTTISVFPNPANNLLNLVIDAQQQVNAKVEVIDLTGRILYTAPVSAAGHYTYTINTANFSAGVYTLQLGADNQSARQKFIVAH